MMKLQLLRRVAAAVAELLLQMVRVVAAVAVDRRFVGWHHNVRNLTVYCRGGRNEKEHLKFFLL